MPSQPFIFIGAAVGLKRLLQHPKAARAHRLLAAGGLIIAGIGVFQSPRYYHATTENRMNAFRELKKTIPPNASVAAQQSLVPHFDTRRAIQLFPMSLTMGTLQSRYLANPAYIVCDQFGNSIPFDSDGLRNAIGTVRQEKKYKEIFNKEGFLVFQRIADEPPVWKS